MPRPPTERPLSESMTVVLRLQRQLELSKRLGPARKKRVKEKLGEVMAELQDAEQGKR